MSDQVSACLRTRCKLTGAENNMVANCVGNGVHVARRLLGAGVRMHPHPRKIAAETLLHIPAQRRLERPPMSSENALDTARHRIFVHGTFPGVALDAWRRAANAGMRGLCQHLIGDAVGFLLVDIRCPADAELRLQGAVSPAGTVLAFFARRRRGRSAGALALKREFATLLGP